MGIEQDKTYVEYLRKARGKLKENFQFLNENDINFPDGKEEELLQKIMRETGRSREEIIQQINELKYE